VSKSKIIAVCFFAIFLFVGGIFIGSIRSDRRASEMESRINSLRTELDDKTRDLGEAVGKYSDLQGQYKNLEERYHLLANEISGFIDGISEVEGQLGSTGGVISEVTTGLSDDIRTVGEVRKRIYDYVKEAEAE
jgi:chromosome segregation ATPase